MSTNPCFYAFGDAFRVLIFAVHIFKPYSRLTKFLSANIFKYNFKTHWSIYFVTEKYKK